MDPKEPVARFSRAGVDEPVRPATQKQQQPEEKYICRDAGKNVRRVKKGEVESDDSWPSEKMADEITRDTIMPLGEVDPAGGDGLSHSGGPEAETEEQADRPMGAGSSIGPVPNGDVKQAPVT